MRGPFTSFFGIHLQLVTAFIFLSATTYGSVGSLVSQNTSQSGNGSFHILNWRAGSRCQTSLLSSGGAIILPSGTKWHTAGLWVTLKGGRQALALRDYIGSHEEMVPLISLEMGRRFGHEESEQYDVAEINYGGELIFEPSYLGMFGQLTVLNHTSSFAFKRLTAEGKTNVRGNELVVRLKEKFPLLVVPSVLSEVKVQEWDPQSPHLLSEMPGNIRHDFYNKIDQLEKAIQEHLELPVQFGQLNEIQGIFCGPQRTLFERLLATHHELADSRFAERVVLSRKDFLNRFLWLVDYLENHPLKIGTGYTAVKSLLTRWENKESFSDEEWDNLLTLVRKTRWDSVKLAEPILVLPL